MIQDLVAYAIVGAAVLYLAGRFGLVRLPRRTPKVSTRSVDVPVSSLQKKR